MMKSPIFIMGPHRSGTTLLHQLMIETGCFDYLSAFHIIKYDSLPSEPCDPATSPAYREGCDTFERLGLTRRVIDDVKICPRAPEEYGLVLDNAGTGARITRKNLALFRDLCSRLRTQPGRDLVLKNPWDCANFLQIKDLIPEARFIFIHRHPERIIHSNLNATRA